MIPLTKHSAKELGNLRIMCREIPDWICLKGRDYPLPSLIAIIILATISGVVRGQRDLAAFAAKLTQAQLRALRTYYGKDKRYHAPKETTFYRILTQLDPVAFEKVLSPDEEAKGSAKDLEEDEKIEMMHHFFAPFSHSARLGIIPERSGSHQAYSFHLL